MKALIAGGGIGGLATAIALAQRGIEVAVYEQSPQLNPIGAGLQISPNGWRVLEALGVIPYLRPALFEPDAIEMRIGRTGAQVFSLPMKGQAEQRWGAPYMHVHRADLHEALCARLNALTPDALHLGQQVIGYEQDHSVASLTLSNHESSPGADLIIAADGLRSALRQQMLGSDAPHYTGYVAWRAVMPVTALGDDVPPPTACIWVGHNRHAVTTRVRAGTMVNFVGIVKTRVPPAEGWRSTGSAANALDDFANWHPSICKTISAAGTLGRWALFDRAPLPSWHQGRVVLLGDAAHPMLPSMAQGAVQALEDAFILAACVARHAEIPTALKAYYKARIDRTARIQKGSAANGRLFHHGSTLGRWTIYGPIGLAARIAPDLLHRRQDWVYGYDPVSAVRDLE